jgi:hypothetical protein
MRTGFGQPPCAVALVSHHAHRLWSAIIRTGFGQQKM